MAGERGGCQEEEAQEMNLAVGADVEAAIQRSDVRELPSLETQRVCSVYYVEQ